MATPSFLCWALLLVSYLLSLLPGSHGFSYTVGDSFGWTIPSETSLNYDHWASSRTFHVGDSLVFNYASDLHSVLQVTRSSYKECNITSPFTTNSDGKTIINLPHKGSYYFICGIPGHCQAGQRFQLKVVDAAGHVETSQAAARGDATLSAPAPAPVNDAVPPATASAPCLPYLRVMMKVMISLVTYTSLIYPCAHAFA